jgi:hypothetical protein
MAIDETKNQGNHRNATPSMIKNLAASSGLAIPGSESSETIPFA